MGVNYGKIHAFVAGSKHMTSANIDLVCKSASRKITLLKLLSKYIDQTSLKQYYNSYNLQVFDYGCVVRVNTTHANVTR